MSLHVEVIVGTYKSGETVWIKPIKVITGVNTGIVSDKIFKL